MAAVRLPQAQPAAAVQQHKGTAVAASSLMLRASSPMSDPWPRRLSQHPMICCVCGQPSLLYMIGVRQLRQRSIESKCSLHSDMLMRALATTADDTAAAQMKKR